MFERLLAAWQKGQPHQRRNGVIAMGIMVWAGVLMVRTRSHTGGGRNCVVAQQPLQSLIMGWPGQAPEQQ